MIEYTKLTTLGALRDLLNSKKNTLPDSMKVMILHLDGKGYQPLEHAVVAPDIRDKNTFVFYLDNESYEGAILSTAELVGKIKKFLAQQSDPRTPRSRRVSSVNSVLKFLNELIGDEHEST